MDLEAGPSVEIRIEAATGTLEAARTDTTVGRADRTRVRSLRVRGDGERTREKT
jgi:hypothetical protein